MTIVEAYAIMIRTGKRTIDQVPTKYRAEVEALLV